MDQNELARRMGITLTGCSSHSDKSRMHLKEGGPAMQSRGCRMPKKASPEEMKAGLGGKSDEWLDSHSRGRNGGWAGKALATGGPAMNRSVVSRPGKPRSPEEEAAGKMRRAEFMKTHPYMGTKRPTRKPLATGNAGKEPSVDMPMPKALAKGGSAHSRRKEAFLGGNMEVENAKRELRKVGMRNRTRDLPKSPRKDYGAENKKVSDSVQPLTDRRMGASIGGDIRSGAEDVGNKIKSGAERVGNKLRKIFHFAEGGDVDMGEPKKVRGAKPIVKGSFVGVKGIKKVPAGSSNVKPSHRI